MRCVYLGAISLLTALIVGCGGGGGDSGGSAGGGGTGGGSGGGSGGGTGGGGTGGGSGGGGTLPDPPTAEGLWTGTTSDNRLLVGHVLADGSYYIIYSYISNSLLIAGAIQGKGSSLNGSFASSDARDYDFISRNMKPITVSASYQLKQSLSGSLSYLAGGAQTFSSVYVASYEQSASLSAASGSYSGSLANLQDLQQSTFTLASNGTISISSNNGCLASGTATPRSRGNLFDVTLQFGPAPCSTPSQSFSGIGYYTPLEKRFRLLAPSPDRNNATLFVGSKP